MIGARVKFLNFGFTITGTVISYSLDDTCKVICLEVNTAFGVMKVYSEDILSVKVK